MYNQRGISWFFFYWESTDEVTSTVPLNLFGCVFSDSSPWILRVTNWITYRAGMTVHSKWLPQPPLTDVNNSSQNAFQPSQELAAFLNTWLLAFDFSLASGLSDLLFFAVYPGMWTMDISYILSLSTLLSKHLPFSHIRSLYSNPRTWWSITNFGVGITLGQFWLSEYLETWPICLVMPYLLIYISKPLM